MPSIRYRPRSWDRNDGKLARRESGDDDGESFGVGAGSVSDRLRCGQRGEIRTEADLGPGPCMIGTAELPGYFAS